jgi:hypothetical protein
MSIKKRGIIVGVFCLPLGVAFVVATFFKYQHSDIVTESQTSFQVRDVGTALGAYFVDCGHYPAEETGLDALIANHGEPGWNGPYLMNNQNSTNLFVDQWGRPLSYRLEGDLPNVISSGPDKTFGTKDDIANRPVHSGSLPSASHSNRVTSKLPP